MTINNINVEESIANARELLKTENVSPAFRAILDVLFFILWVLIERVTKNSRNSHIPPSQDPNRSRDNNKEKKKAWAQTWHSWNNLTPFWESEVDEIVEIPMNPEQLSHDKEQVRRKVWVEKRQVVDLVIKRQITEYQAEVWKDQYGNREVAKFPERVKTHVQYGDVVKSQASYMEYYQLIPYDRIGDYFKSLMGLEISPWSLIHWWEELYKSLDWFEELLKQELLKSTILHADETGINIWKKRHWMHVLSNQSRTYLHADEKRWDKAMKAMKVLDEYTNILVHDHWAPYYTYQQIVHALCNAHILRELEWLIELYKKNWLWEMKKLLLEMHEWKNTQTKEEFENNHEKREEFFLEYDEIVQRWEKETPEAVRNPWEKKRWRIKKEKDRNILERFMNYKEVILRFLMCYECPFTNNQAERDIRMTKVQQKISGCFRTMDWAKRYARIRSYIDSSRKQGYSPIYAIEKALQGKPLFTSPSE